MNTTGSKLAVQSIFYKSAGLEMQAIHLQVIYAPSANILHRHYTMHSRALVAFAQHDLKLQSKGRIILIMRTCVI